MEISARESLSGWTGRRSRSIQAQALAEFESVTVALADRSLSEKLRTANVLEVRGEGATLRLPLDGSTAALERLERALIRTARVASRRIHSLRLAVGHKGRETKGGSWLQFSNVRYRVAKRHKRYGRKRPKTLRSHERRQ